MHPFDGAAHRPAIREAKIPEIILRCGQHMTDRGHRIQIEECIAVWLGARQFQRKPSCTVELPRQQHLPELTAAAVHPILISGKPGEYRYLHDPAGAMVVLRLALLNAIRMRRHPFDILREPVTGISHDISIDTIGIAHDMQGLGDLHHLDHIDHADGTPRHPALDRLGVKQGWIHTGGRIRKPGARMPHGMTHISAFAREQPGRGQVTHQPAESYHRPAMGEKIRRIGESVALDVWTVRMHRIRPPVVSFGEKIMRTTGRTRTSGSRDRDRRFLQRQAAQIHDVLTIPGRHRIKQRLCRCHRNDLDQEEGQPQPAERHGPDRSPEIDRCMRMTLDHQSGIKVIKPGLPASG